MAKDPELKSVEVYVTDTPIPKAKMDSFCKFLLEMHGELFSDPAERERYEAWLPEYKKLRAIKGAAG